MNYKLYNETNRRIAELEELMGELAVQIANLPEGKLQVHKNGKYPRPRLALGSERRDFTEAEEELMQQLAFKGFLESRLYDYQSEHTVLLKFLKICEADNAAQIKHFREAASPEEASAVYQFLNNPLKAKLLKASYKSFNEKAYEWAQADYPHCIPTAETHPHEDCFGRPMRSKTERDIANIYNKYNVPFRYEEETIVNGHKYYIDFKVCNFQAQKIYPHEHFGMWDDPEYVLRNMKKLSDMAVAEYVPNSNFIVTYETKKHPLDIYEFEEYVRTKLILPWNIL